MPEFDAILFDFDGVLIDSEPVHWACWAEVLAPLGANLTWEWYRDNGIGIDDREMVRIIAAGCEPRREWEHLWERYPAKRELFRARMLEAPPFPAGLRGLLESLRPEYKMAVVTSSGRAEIEPMLEKAGLRPFFDTLVCARDTARHKPAPDPYLLAASRLGARRPLVVEDSEPGLASGRAAGFEVLAVKDPAGLSELLLGRLSGPVPSG